mmetsp:Transcript_5628/g.18853  ORF Transcript_5628/g.18853 Transcript_5628/m.18853 type:complete len:258 (-) Transcript_5628:823-1596(-)
MRRRGRSGELLVSPRRTTSTTCSACRRSCRGCARRAAPRPLQRRCSSLSSPPPPARPSAPSGTSHKRRCSSSPSTWRTSRRGGAGGAPPGPPPPRRNPQALHSGSSAPSSHRHFGVRVAPQATQRQRPSSSRAARSLKTQPAHVPQSSSSRQPSQLPQLHGRCLVRFFFRDGATDPSANTAPASPPSLPPSAAAASLRGVCPSLAASRAYATAASAAVAYEPRWRMPDWEMPASCSCAEKGRGPSCRPLGTLTRTPK